MPSPSIKSIYSKAAGIAWFIVVALIVIRVVTLWGNWRVYPPLEIASVMFLVAFASLALLSYLKQSPWQRAIGAAYFLTEALFGLASIVLELLGRTDFSTHVSIVAVYLVAAAAIATGDPHVQSNQANA
jgi:uncharacterized membrane protein YhhN